MIYYKTPKGSIRWMKLLHHTYRPYFVGEPKRLLKIEDEGTEQNKPKQKLK